jgi:hypothetical protein
MKTFVKSLAACSCALLASLSLAGCKFGGSGGNSSGSGGGSKPGDKPTPVSASNGETGVEKVKPAPGTGNVQGTVLYNGKPVENIDVKLCEKFNRFMGGCDGKIIKGKTDKDGVYVIANVEPKVYESLQARSFDSDYWIFATSGFAGLDTTKYDVAADKTLFVQPINLFKDDLKIDNPKAGSKVSAKGLELKWEPYPDAAYYKFSLHSEDLSVTSPYVDERVDATSYGLDKPIKAGTYRVQIESYNSADKKLSESPDDYKFTITDGTAQ